MKKKILLITSLVLCVLSIFLLSSCGFIKDRLEIPFVGLEYTLNEDGTSYSVTDLGLHIEKDIVIPSEHNGKPVTSIGYGAFSWCDSLTSIVISDSVTSIGYGAFAGCDSLTSIIIPDSVTSIGEWAFYECDNLTSIVIPDSVTSIGEWAFYECVSLSSVVIPNSVTSIGEYAFKNCESLTIYCEAEEKPSGWDEDWNYSNCPVVWGYKE